MENIKLNNGRNVIIGSERDVLEVIQETLGYDFADAVKHVFDSTDEVEKYKKYAEIESQEKESYEASLESINNALYEALEKIEELENYLADSKRISKNAVCEILTQIHRVINAEL